MLRQVVSKPFRRCAASDGGFQAVRRETYATSGKKRKISKNQLAGVKDPPPVGRTTKPMAVAGTTASSSVPSTSGTPIPPPPSSSTGSGGGGGSGMMIGGAVLIAGGAGGYYYYTQIEGRDISEIPLLGQLFTTKQTKESPQETPTAITSKEKKPVQISKEETPSSTEEAKEPSPIVEEEKPVVAATKEEEEQVVATEVEKVPSTTPVAVQKTEDEQLKPAVEETIVELQKEIETSSDVDLSTATAAAREIRLADDNAASETLWKAHQSLKTNLDENLLKDLDTLSVSELKVRVVQLATEMKDRTKWEAVRLKEFLAMKDKETSDKYMEILQKQRIEFEGLMARRLLEVENELQRKANAALQEKENTIQAVVKAAADAQEAEHETTLKSTEDRLDREINAKYEVEYETKLANEKASFVTELETKVGMIEQLSEKLRQLESSLQASLTYESGSQHAHRVSGAAMALAAKMETSKGAADELLALKSAAGDDGVIASALSSVPSSIKAGVPTLPELQAKFESVYKKSRQAALVPDGWVGLDGQLLGIAFASLKLAPSADDPAPDNEKDSPEYLLARAHRHVQVGELERAVEQLDKLDGQAAFTVCDWKKDANDRIAVEKALQVIKMECALLNESLSGGSGNGNSSE